MPQALMTIPALSFGRLAILPEERRVLLDGEPVPIGARAFDVLVALVAQRDRVVPKKELLAQVWRGLHVEENNLTVQVSTLRKLLGPAFISTVPGRGYRFVAKEGPAVPSALGIGADPRPAPAADSLPPSRMPRAHVPLYGREADLVRLRQALSTHRLVTLVGIGGVGKSHLAQHVLRAREAAAGSGSTIWVELAGSAREFVAGALAAAAGVAVRGMDTLAELVAGLRSREVMIGIDNAEHIADEVARVAAALLEGAPGTTLLVTSQTPLHLAHEQVVRLAPLELAPAGSTADAAMSYGAVELFVRRAQEADLRFELQPQNVAAAIDICRHLDGLPLALELAAARTSALRLAGLATLLSDPMRLLTSTSGSHDPRHRALRVTLEWSHGLLHEREKVAFRRLAVFSGGCSLAMAREVLAGDAGPGRDGAGQGGIADDWAALDALGELVERSLVDADNADPPRYRLLETTRIFALEQLHAAGEAPAIRALHARAVVDVFLHADREMAAGRLGRDAALDALWNEIDNARAALAWALAHAPGMAIELVPALDEIFKGVVFAEVRRMWEATLPLMDARSPAPLRARWALGYAHFCANRDAATARHWAQIAADIYTGLDDPPRLLRALYLLAGAKALGGLDAGAELARLRAIDCTGLPVATRFMQVLAEGVVTSILGHTEVAISHYERALPLAAVMGDRERHSVVLLNLIDMEMLVGRLDDAIRHGEELLASLRGGRFLEATAIALHHLAAALIAKGALPEARRIAEQGLPLAADHSMLVEWADHLALLAALEHRPDDAARLLGYGDARRGSARTNIEAASALRAQEIAREACGSVAFERARAAGRDVVDDLLPGLGLGRR